MAPCSLSSLEGLDNVMQNGGLVDHSFCALETFQSMSDFPQSGVILHMYRLYLYMNRTLPPPSFAKMSVFDGFWTCGLFNVAQAGGHRSHKLAVNHSQLHILFWKLSCCSLSVCQIIVIYSRSFHLPVLRLVKFGNPVKNKTVTCKPALVWLDDPECRLRDIHADHNPPERWICVLPMQKEFWLIFDENEVIKALSCVIYQKVSSLLCCGKSECKSGEFSFDKGHNTPLQRELFYWTAS